MTIKFPIKSLIFGVSLLFVIVENAGLIGLWAFALVNILYKVFYPVWVIVNNVSFRLDMAPL